MKRPLHPNQQFFSHVSMFSWVELVLSNEYKHSTSDEAQTRDLLISRIALYHWVTFVVFCLMQILWLMFFEQPWLMQFKTLYSIPGHVAQLVTCLAKDASLTADPGVASSIPARSHTFVEIDHEIISTVILLPSAESF